MNYYYYYYYWKCHLMFCIIFSTCRRVLLVGASQCIRALPGLRCGFDSLSLPTRLLRLRRVELPQLRHGGAGGPLCVRPLILPLIELEMFCCMQLFRWEAVAYRRSFPVKSLILFVKALWNLFNFAWETFSLSFPVSGHWPGNISGF